VTLTCDFLTFSGSLEFIVITFVVLVLFTCDALVYVIQELLQNAEDAGATVVKFLYDNNNYGQDSSKLSAPRLAKYQVGLCNM